MADAEPQAAIAARYGRTRSRARRQRWWIVAAAIAVAAVFAAWVVWGGQVFSPDTALETSDVGFQTHGDTSVTVRWSLTIDPGTRAACAVEALDDDYRVVGWKVVDVPASAQRTRGFSQDLRTTGTADTGLISSCWAA